MSMSSGATRSNIKAEPNVTPMIDVMLVLLIIFMLVIPSISAGFQAVPPQGVNLKPHPEEDRDQVLGIDADGQYFLNKAPIPNAELPQRLKAIYENREEDQLLYVKAHKDLEYGKVLDALDIASKNNVRVTGMITDQAPGTVSLVATDNLLGGGGMGETVMSMSTGDAGGAGGSLTNEINVTPMIDVLLVLLIIFMLVVPMSRKAIDLQLPDPTETTESSNPPPQIVLEVLAGERYLVNKEAVPKARLLARLKEIYDPRPEKIIFVKGAPIGVKYSEVIFAMDVARGAGVKVIGVSPKDAAPAAAP